MLYLPLDTPPRAVFPVHTRGSALTHIRSSTIFWIKFNQSWRQCPRMQEEYRITAATEMDGKVYVTALLTSGFAPFMYMILTRNDGLPYQSCQKLILY